MDFKQDNPLMTIDAPDQLEQWRTALTKCDIHRPNHPHYDEVYLAVMSHAEGKYLYMLRIDSNDNNHVDLVPFEIIESAENTVRVERGNYRCEGLMKLVEHLPN